MIRTNEQMVEEFCKSYKAYQRAEEEKRKIWNELSEEWENGGFEDKELGNRVKAVEKECDELELKTNIFARLALDYILKDERAEDEQ